jgi:hypothetical protein
MTKEKAAALAIRMAQNAGLTAAQAQQIADRLAPLHDPEFTTREVQDFIRVEIERHGQAVCSGCGGAGTSPLDGMVGFMPATCSICGGTGRTS